MNKAELGRYICCPNCRGNLEIGRQIICTRCGAQFFEKDKILSLLPDDLSRQNLAELQRFSKHPAVMKHEKGWFEKHCTTLNFNDNFRPRIAKTKVTVLEVGAGVVAVSRLFKQINKDNVVIASDLSRASLERIDMFDKHGAVDAKIQANMEKLPFRNSMFDYVIGSATLHHILKLDKAINEISRVLKPGGIYLGMNEPYGSLLFQKTKVLRFGRKKEMVRSIKEYENSFTKNSFSPKIILTTKLKHQKPQIGIVYAYYFLYNIMPHAIQKRLGGNVLIVAKKKVQ